MISMRAKVFGPSNAGYYAAIEAVKTGGIVIVPTENVYGFIVSSKFPDSIDRIYKIKKRPTNKAMVISVTKDIASKYGYLSPLVVDFINDVWPAPIVIIVNKKDTVPDQITCGKDTVAMLSLNSEVVNRVVTAVEGPICGTTCNFSGEKAVTTVDKAIELFGDLVDVIIEGDQFLKNGKASTIINFVEDPPQVLRIGSYSPEVIKQQFIPNLNISFKS